MREHTALCPGVTEQTRLFRENFTLSDVHIIVRVRFCDRSQRADAMCICLGLYTL